MEIQSYEPSMLADIVAVYNRTVADVPHTYPVAVETMSEAVAGACSGRAQVDSMDDEAVFVARSDGRALGFIHVGVGRGPEGKDPQRGVIRFLGYRRGHRQAGQALLDVAHVHLRRCGMARVEAFQCEYRYPFYQLYWSCLSDRLDHIRGLLGFNGYEIIKGEVYMDAVDFEPFAPVEFEAPLRLELDRPQGPGARPGVHARAMRGNDEVGSCSCVCVGDASRHELAQHWAFVKSLNVIESHQGRGIGRVLLLTALAEMHALGHRHAVISTNTTNYRAMLFYGNYGFRAVDWTYSFWREL